MSVSEFTGKVVFTDSDNVWYTDGYVWDPKAIELYASIYYVVSISFTDANNKVIKTEATKFFVPTTMNGNKAPLIFFNGDTVDPSIELYENESIDAVISYIAQKGNNEFLDTRILIRGHASFTSTDTDLKKREQFALLELSQKRAVVIFNLLAARGLDSTRMFYEAFGGSAEVSNLEEDRWKNRRVEVLFIDDIDDTRHKEEGQASISQEKETIKEPVSATNNPIVIEKNIEPWPDIPILGEGHLNVSQMASFILYYTPTVDQEYIDYLKESLLYMS